MNQRTPEDPGKKFGKSSWKGWRGSHELKSREHWHRWDHEPPDWPKMDSSQRRKFFLRFFGIFVLMVILGVGGMAALAYILSQLFDGGGRLAALAWFLGCGLSLALPLLAVIVGVSVFRGIATPIADVMSAADSVAGGDFSVRVPEPKRGPREFRRLTTSFNRMTEELERLDNQRRNLTADVAHELRTPLHIIQGNLEGILDGVYQPTEEQLQVLLDEIRLLSRLVEDLQTLSLAEAGQLTLKLEPVDITELLTDVSTSFSGQMDAAGIDLKVEVNQESGSRDGDDAIELIIEADVERLDQIITNLVANALRHTPRGGEIKLKAKPIAGGVQILVQDTGEGISSEDLPNIFERFWKGDRTRTRADGSGSGLGLAITRKLVESHGGTIGVESELGVGSTFVVELPG